jgi:uncharacterized protein YjiS (DUF1127 family)
VLINKELQMTIDLIKLSRNEIVLNLTADWTRNWILRLVKRVLLKLAGMLQTRRDRKMLMSMSDTMLKDIGISRCDVYRITKQSTFEAPHSEKLKLGSDRRQ